WPLPTMVPLAQTLALLAMTTATAVMDEVPMDMAPNSFDDQYWGCRDKMTAALPALHRSELQQNSLFAQAWAQARAEWQKRGSRVSPLSSSDQAIALMAYTMDKPAYTVTTPLFETFNTAVREAGYSRWQYRNKFHFKVLHFLLTDALATLRDTQGKRCRDVFRGVSGKQFNVTYGKKVRFGQFTSTSLNKTVSEGYGTDTLFQVTTCYGVDIQHVSFNPREQEVLIPPFETFKVTKVTQDGDKTRIWLHSNGTYSNYNCEWLRGDSMGTPSEG
ncbi:NARE ribosyltransferase, partial [Malurus elegans]|nr:NARE ribosyltransferase [Malurus elegans]